MHQKNNGFTLIEVLLVSVIGAFIALAAVGALKAASVVAEMVNGNIEIAGEVRFAAEKIAGDLLNLYKDRNYRNTKFVGTIRETNTSRASLLSFYTIGRVKARDDQPEGDVYEVSYYLVNNEDKSMLMRQIWPNPDKIAQPREILTSIAENIDVFEVRFFDGQNWQSEWSEDAQSLPKLVEIIVAAREPGRDSVIKESFIINLRKSTALETGLPEGGTESEYEANL